MNFLNASRSELPRSAAYSVFSGPAEDLTGEIRHLAFLVDAWLIAQDATRPNSSTARRAEKRLHEAIKSGPLFGKILSFAGLNLWVDDRTSIGHVETQESISL